MAGLVSIMNGLVVKHPIYGHGVVIGEDKYGRLILKLVGGHQVNSINKGAVTVLSEKEVFESDVFHGLSSTGMIAFVRTPYSDKKKNLTEGEIAPWVCKVCHQTFDPDLPNINYDKGEKGFRDRKNLICPKCGSDQVKYLGDADDKADMYSQRGSGNTFLGFAVEGVDKEPDIGAIKILESLVEDVVLSEGLGYELAKAGQMGTEGFKNLIKQGVLKKEDFFKMPDFIKVGKELWEHAVEVIWKTGKVLDKRGLPNFGAVVNVWKSLYKRKYGDYPQPEKEGGMEAFFQKQGEKMGALLSKMASVEQSGVKMGGRAKKEREKAQSYLQALAQDIENVRDDIIGEYSGNAVEKIDDILEKIERRSSLIESSRLRKKSRYFLGY